MQISGRLLGEALQLPSGHTVIGAVASNGGHPVLVIKGPGLPEPNDDGSFKLVRPNTCLDVFEVGSSLITGFEAVD